MESRERIQRVAAAYGYALPASRAEGNAMMFARFAKAAEQSNRPDAQQLASHYSARASREATS